MKLLIIAALSLGFVFTPVYSGTSSTAKAEKTSVQEINKNSSNFIGRKVRVEGEVEEIVTGGQSFIIEGDNWTKNEILVVSKGRILNLDQLADENRRVTLTGTVKYANFYEISNNLNSGIDPDMELDKKKGVTYILLDNFESTGKLSE